MFKDFSIRDLAIQVTIAAIYVVVVLAFYFMSFEVIQFRIAEILLVLVFFNKKHTIGLVVGTFIANWIGIFGIIDAIYGSIATLITCLLLIQFKKYWIPAIIIIPAVINGLIISLEIAVLYDLWHEFFVNFLWIGLGELTVLVVLGIPFKLLLDKSEVLHIHLK